MTKVIIQNDSSHKIEDVLVGVIEVIKLGRISGLGYCAVTTFHQDYRIIAVCNTKSDRFVIQDTYNLTQQELELKNNCE